MGGGCGGDLVVVEVTWLVEVTWWVCGGDLVCVCGGDLVGVWR